MPRRKLLLALPLIAVGLVVALSQRNVIEARFHTLPQISPNSAHSQNGLELVRLNKLDEGYVMMLVRVPQLPEKMASNGLRKFEPADAFHVVAHDSISKSWPLGWDTDQDRNGYSTLLNSNSSDPNLLVIDLPPSFPPQIQWVDIEIRDKWKRKAIWRLNNLPRAKQVTDDSVQINDTYNRDGVFVHGSATLDHWDTVPSNGPQVTIKVTAAGLPSSQYRWVVKGGNIVGQWVNLDADVTSDFSKGTWILPVSLSPGATVESIKSEKASGGVGTSYHSYYPQLDRYVKISLQLVKLPLATNSQRNGDPISVTPIELIVPIVDKGSMETRRARRKQAHPQKTS